MSKFNFTYQTKNLVNDKTYIGVHCTDNMNGGYIGSGALLSRAIDKYGKENFKLEPLCFFDTPFEAFDEEEWLVNDDWIKLNDNYNVKLGGCGGFDHINKNGLNNTNQGKTFSDDHRQKISEALKGKPKSEEHRKKLSECRSGENHPNWGKTSGMKGKTLSTRQKQEISKRTRGNNNPMYGVERTDEWKQTHSEFMKSYYKINESPRKGKPVVGQHLENLKKSLRNQLKITCEHCGKSTTNGNFTRWHGDNCKMKK